MPPAIPASTFDSSVARTIDAPTATTPADSAPARPKYASFARAVTRTSRPVLIVTFAPMPLVVPPGVGGSANSCPTRFAFGAAPEIEADAPAPVDLSVAGGIAYKAAVIPVALHYTTTGPLA